MDGDVGLVEECKLAHGERERVATSTLAFEGNGKVTILSKLTFNYVASEEAKVTSVVVRPRERFRGSCDVV